MLWVGLTFASAKFQIAAGEVLESLGGGPKDEHEQLARS